MKIMQLIGGIILLLPGICSLYFVYLSSTYPAPKPGTEDYILNEGIFYQILLPIWVVSFSITIVAIYKFAKARARRHSEQDH